MRTLVLSFLIFIVLAPSIGCGGGQREAEREPPGGDQGSLYERAETAFMAGDDDEASALLAEIAEDAPESARAHNLRGLIHARRGNTALATLEFKEALRIDPKLSQAHNNLGALYLQDGRLELATASLESAVAEDPYYLAAHKSLAEAYYKSGQMDKAQEELNLVKELESAQSASASGSLQDLQIGQPLDVAELIQQEETRKEEERQAEAKRAAAKKAAAAKAAQRPTTKTVRRQVSAPAGTILTLSLAQPLSSATAQINQPVSAHVVGDVYIGQDLLIRNGAAVKGKVTEAESSGRVKGRATLAFAFHQVETVDGWRDVSAHLLEGSLEAEGTKKEDAAKIGVGAAAGAVLGKVLGGSAKTGAIIGGAAGTGLVLSTKGKEVELEAGAAVDLELDQPLSITIEKTVTVSD